MTSRPLVRPSITDRTDWRYYHPACGRMSHRYLTHTTATRDAANHDCARPKLHERAIELSPHSRFQPQQ